MIDKDRFTEEINALNKYIKSRNLNHVEEALLLRSMVDFITDNRVVAVLKEIDVFKTTKKK